MPLTTTRSGRTPPAVSASRMVAVATQVRVDVFMHPETVHGEISHDPNDRWRIAKTSLVLRHRAARKGVRADDGIGSFALHERAQVARRKLMRPGSKATNFRRPFGAIVDVAIELRDGLDHSNIAVRNDA